MAESDFSCADHDPNMTLVYNIAYFFSIWLVLFILNLSPLGNRLVAHIGEDCYHYWKEYRDTSVDQMVSKKNYIEKTRQKYRKIFRCCRKRSMKLAQAATAGRNVGFLEWLLEADDFFTGSNGKFTKPKWFLCCGPTIPPGALEDCIYYLFNNHGFLSTMFAESDHPYSRNERNFAFLALNCLTYFGVACGTLFSQSQTQLLLWKVVAMGMLNYTLTNLFQGLFSCQCLLGTSVGVESKLEYYIRRAMEIIGSMFGSMLAVMLSVGMLTVASQICPDEGRGLLPFAIRTQLAGIAIGIIFPVMQYLPVVVHITGIPMMKEYVASGSWYMEKYEEGKEFRDEWVKENLHIIEKNQFYYFQLNMKGKPFCFSTDVDDANVLMDELVDDERDSANGGSNKGKSSSKVAPEEVEEDNIRKHSEKSPEQNA